MNAKTNYEQTNSALIQSGVPESFYDDLIVTVEEFEKNHIELLRSDKQAFYILLLGTIYKMGYNAGKAAD